VNGDTDWKALAERLAAELEELRARLVGLAAVLPPEYLTYLHAPFDRAAGTFEVLDGWDEIDIVKSDVVTEMNDLWRRLS